MSSAPTTADPASLAERISAVPPRDEQRMRRRLDSARGLRDAEARQRALARLAGELEAAEARLAARRASVPPLTYPPDLPVSQRKDDIGAAIRDHQVVIVAGETGSGKTTQLPKICLGLGRGVRGLIGHTQPRRLAARTVADRIADELGTPLGETVGYTVRFTDRVGPNTLVKLMTDGILLAEIQHDRDLRRYDTLIIDEAHERSLNIDFILGYVKRLLPRRPDLKVIITSATIETERFSEHFDGAPVIEVSGRTYPVEVRYRPINEDTTDQTQAILDAVDELTLEGPGDILVFLSGEREIRDTADALRRHVTHRGALDPDLEILPLYARLSAAEQHRVFSAHPGRRVVLATNVAETSLTVPGIRYVIDPGTARVSRYSHRLKVQRLPIERISQASANQRKGRCGRVAAGICVRLYSEEDFLSRPEYTEPEILRTNLASVILRMAALGLGEVAEFPFVEPPDRRNIRDGVQLLHELGALDPSASDPRDRLTPLGRQLAQLPLDPRFGRMILEAERDGVVHEVLVIAAALSIQDPRERPADHQQAADDKHRRFAVEGSDFLSYLALWDYITARQKELSGSAFRRLCGAEYLHFLRIREWQDLYGQLRQVARGLGIEARPPAAESAEVDLARVHTALLAGLLGHIGMQVVDAASGRPAATDGGRPAGRREYLGARGAKFAIFPGSGLFRKPPRWVMAAELVETSRLYARVCGRIEPEWVEPLAGHLVKRAYSEPHWEKKRGSAVAYEKVTLYGVPIVAARKVQYGRIDPELSRELFIRHALVEGDWETHHRFFGDNRAMLSDVEQLEARARRRDIVVDDQALFDFYDARIPADVVSARHFDAWWKKTRRDQPDLLTFDPSMLVTDAAATVSPGDYPDTWRQGDLRLRLSYQFEPGTEADGVTAHVPLDVLNRVQPAGFDWQIPGLRGELVAALIRSLPKPLRRQLVPVPDHARELLARLPAGPETGRADLPPLTEALADLIWQTRGVDIPADAWDLTRVPHHLKITFRVVDDRGGSRGEDKDLLALRGRLAPQVRRALADAFAGAAAGTAGADGGVGTAGADGPAGGPGADGGVGTAGADGAEVPAHEIERAGLTGWEPATLPELPERVERRRGGRVLLGYPALVDDGDSVSVRVLESRQRARSATWGGLRRLLALALPSPVKPVVAALDNRAKLALGNNPYGGVPALLDDARACVLDAFLAEHLARDGELPRTADAFAALRERARAEQVKAVLDVVRLAAEILAQAHELRRALERTAPAAARASVDDARAQLRGLVHPGFLSETGRDRLPDVLRYLRALARRLDRLAEDPARDQAVLSRLRVVEREYHGALAGLPDSRREDPDVRAVRWMLEELRISLFAQPMRTAYPVSDKRIYRALDAWIS